MDPITAAAAISGGAQLVGSFYGANVSAKESSKNRKEARRQFNIQDEYNKNRLQYTINDAIKAGVNPVAAINSGSASYSPTVSAGGTSGAGEMIADGISKAGRSISDMILNRQARQDRAIALESANLDLETKRLQNDILRSKLAVEKQPGIVPNGTVGDLYKPWKDRNGNIVYLLNPDAIADADWSNLEALKAYASNLGNAVQTGTRPNWFSRAWYRISSRSNPLAAIYPNKKWR